MTCSLGVESWSRALVSAEANLEVVLLSLGVIMKRFESFLDLHITRKSHSCVTLNSLDLD